jgi:hypothetical protein
MTKREYLKYSQEMYDMQNQRIYPGDTVVINNNYGPQPYIGTVTHFVESGRVAIESPYYKTANGKQYYSYFYREPENILKIKDGNKDSNKDSAESQFEFTK